MSKGFTLAEVLITLGIIGVVAAISAPTLNSSLQKSRVAPALRKFMSTMENANTRILQNKDSDLLTTAIDDKLDNYLAELSKVMKQTITVPESQKIPTTYKYNGTLMQSAWQLSENTKICQFEDGSAMWIEWYGEEQIYEPKGSYKGDVADVVFDINGFDVKPNKLGKDIFYFAIDDNGSVIPFGGNAHSQAYVVSKTIHWSKNTGDRSCNDKRVGVGDTCAASIADNDWKIIYKY